MPDATVAVRCTDLVVGYGAAPVLQDVDLRVEGGQVLALLGASGSGKTTLLHTLAGFLRPTRGEVHLARRAVAGAGRWVPPEHREIGLVFQGAALWPHLDVRDTVAYPMRRRGRSRADARRDAEALLGRVGLSALADRYPAQLSGGEQQRVGLARALARDPALFLFDEPTASLDPHLRAVVLEEIAQRRAALGAAAVYATHDAGEALAVADVVAVLRDGRVVQAGPPREVYERPVDLDVARLTGPVSLLHNPPGRGAAPAQADEAGIVAAGVGTGTGVGTDAGSGAGSPPRWLVRPEWVSFGGDVPAVVRTVRYRGPHTDYEVAADAELLLVRQTGPPRHAVDEAVTVAVLHAWQLRPGPAGGDAG